MNIAPKQITRAAALLDKYIKDELKYYRRIMACPKYTYIVDIKPICDYLSKTKHRWMCEDAITIANNIQLLAYHFDTPIRYVTYIDADGNLLSTPIEA